MSLNCMQKKDRNLLLLLVLVHAAWYIAGLLWQHFYNGDSYEYIYLADSIRQGHYYSGNPALPVNEYKQSLRTPAYSLFLMLFYNLAGYRSWLLFLLQNVLSVASCYILFRTAIAWQPGQRFRRYYLLFLCCYPAQMFFADMVVPDTLLQFFLVLYLHRLLSSLQSPRPGSLLAMSLWLVLATLTKPIVYPYLFLHLIFALVWSIKRRKPSFLAAGLLPVLVMAGYGLWNQQRTGLFHISSVQSVNLLEHNMNRFLEHRYGRPYADSVIGRERAVMADMPHLKEKYEYASGKASAILRDNLVPYALFHARESLRFFIDPGKSELDLFAGSLTYHGLVQQRNFYSSYRDGGFRGALDYLAGFPLFPLVLLTALVNLLRLLGALLFLAGRGIPLPLKIACGIYVIYFAAITGPVANTRYFLPVLPLLSAMAAMGWAALPGMIAFKRKKRYDT